MEIKKLLEKISQSLANNHLKNPNILILLEYIRDQLIENLRSKEDNELKKLNAEIINNKKTSERIINDGIFFETKFEYYEIESTKNELELNSNMLEIVIFGEKKFKIFDIKNKKKYMNYNVRPFYGIAMSNNTLFSSKIIKNSGILSINVDNISKNN